MSHLDEIRSLYGQSKSVNTIVEGIASNTQRLQINGLIGSSKGIVVSVLAEKLDGYHLIIAESKESASTLFSDLLGIHTRQNVLFLPDSFKSPQDFSQVDNNNILSRTEIVNRLTLGEGFGALVVTFPEALFEQVVAPAELETAKLTVIKGEKLDVDFLIEVFIEYGFERVDFVYEPGQFSIRGGIVDIFSFAHDYPYRIDLFDDEVESIRTFDPDTQLSQANIAKIQIVPNINTQFSREHKISLFELLPKDAFLWIEDNTQLLDRLQTCFDKAQETAQILKDLPKDESLELSKHFAFIQPHQIIESIANFRQLGLGLRSMVNPTITVHFNIQPQPSFNKNFELLIQNMQENRDKDNVNYLFTDNAKQIERFYNIFEDLKASVQFTPIKVSISEGFIDEELKLACYTDHQIFERYYRNRSKKGFAKSESLNIKLLRELQPGDYVTHIDHGVGVYAGLQKIEINGKKQEAVRLNYLNSDTLYVSINSLHKISKFVGKDGTPPKVHKLGSDVWEAVKRKTKKRVKDIAEKLIKLYAARRATKGHSFSPDGYLQNELEASFIYEDTPDQETVTQDVKEDMMKEYPMDRLICGDVGFGKTEIAIRAAFKAITDGKQVAVLVPTTILALQHAKTFKERLEHFGADIDFVNRFKSAKEKKEILQKAKEGKLDIIIGTHALLGKEVAFKDLGLLIIDEEQKFGVAAKEKIRALQVNVDTLTLTATPIPRTLQFSLLGARDLSIIRTPPPNRQPIHTEVRVFNDDVIKEAIYNEVYRGGQVFFVHNRVQSLLDMAALVKRLCPDIDIGIAHGQMEPSQLEDTLLDFIERKYDVLLCTNIIETGLDIANANTIIINNAHQFGMSDLHQLRGRVGRSNKKAYCFLFCPPLNVLTAEARKRLKTLEEFSDLGSGFNIAMRDMDIRGAGNLLGGEQSGFISDIGYETYQKILDEAIQELKETDFRELFKDDLEKKRQFVSDVQVELEEEMLFPNDYVSNVQERLLLYRALEALKDEEGIDSFRNMLHDRFGKVPNEVELLFDALRIQWYCKDLGFDRIIYKGKKLRCYFLNSPQSMYYETKTFKNIMQYIQVHASGDLAIKQSNNTLIMVRDNLKSLEYVKGFLLQIHAEVMEKG